MLHHLTLEKLQTLRLFGMLKALAEQMNMPDIDALGFEERLGLLADREITERENRRLTTRLRQAKLKHNACVEDIDYRAPRGLDKALVLQLAAGFREKVQAQLNCAPAVRLQRQPVDVNTECIIN